MIGPREIINPVVHYSHDGIIGTERFVLDAIPEERTGNI
jgi:hypothetical protein